MATVSHPDITLGAGWVNLVSLNAALSGQRVLLQNVLRTPAPAQVVFGGSSAPTSTGVMLAYLDSVEGQSDNIWVRSAGRGRLSVTAL